MPAFTYPISTLFIQKGSPAFGCLVMVSGYLQQKGSIFSSAPPNRHHSKKSPASQICNLLKWLPVQKHW
jgi:hypothetical protein